jgi:hypothetical protein
MWDLARPHTARPIRIEYEGVVYHVAIRGNERRELGKALVLCPRDNVGLSRSTSMKDARKKPEAY